MRPEDAIHTPPLLKKPVWRWAFGLTSTDFAFTDPFRNICAMGNRRYIGKIEKDVNLERRTRPRVNPARNKFFAEGEEPNFHRR
jgi:hypothetical protein